MPFMREHHQKIAHVLESLNHEKLSNAHCYFGGGTAIALKYDEFRESVGIDFMVSDIVGYRQLRSDATGPGGLANLFLNLGQIDAGHDVRADQYGIRSIVKIMGSSIRFEIVLEGRIPFDQPSDDDKIHGVQCLTVTDLIASKLLANSDRWGDVSVFSRDLIDLVMMRFTTREWQNGFEKSTTAYGESIQRDLIKACDAFVDKPMHVQGCLSRLKMNIPPTVLVDKVRGLKSFLSKKP
uniref:nucleotidyl transferase AbiEii/AbiGii toxin family protein n=2 Tax=Polynucleobacter sp. TaxID=2029855 RepID=UPI00404780E0